MRLFTTADAALALRINMAHASVLLRRCLEDEWLVRLARGKWALLEPTPPHPFAVARFLAHNSPLYITGPTSLYHHGVLLQIPRTVHVGWTDNPKVFETPIGTFRFHRLPPSENDEVETEETPEGPVTVAIPEKALIDTARLSASPRGGLSVFPEIDVNELNQATLKKLLRRIENPLFRKRVEGLMLPLKSSMTDSRQATFETALDKIRKFVDHASGWNSIGCFVGAGLSKNAGLPLGGAELVQSLGRRMAMAFRGGNIIENTMQALQDPKFSGDVPALLEKIRKATTEKLWQSAVEEIFNTTPNDVIYNFTDLGAMLYLTTNIDTLLEQAIANPKGRNSKVNVWPQDKGEPIHAILHRPGPSVVHLHGVMDLPDTWILTSRDYTRIRADEPIKTFVREALTARPFLFVGYSLNPQDDHILKILESLHLKLGQWNHKHLALFPADEIVSNPDKTELLFKKYSIVSVGIPRDRLGELWSQLPPKKSTPRKPETLPSWRRELLNTAHLKNKDGSLKWYIEPRIIPHDPRETVDAEAVEMERMVKGETQTIPPAEVLRLGRAVVFGPFGTGKTTYLLRRFAEQDPISGRPMVLLQLREIGSAEEATDFARRKLAAQCRVSESESANVFNNFIQAGGVFLIDGLDELSDRQAVLLSQMSDFAASHPRCGFLITSRPNAGGIAERSLQNFHFLELLPFSENLLDDYTERRMGKRRFFESDQLRELCKYPTFLDMACELYKNHSAPKDVDLSILLGTLLDRRLQIEKDQGRLINEPQIVRPWIYQEAFEMQRTPIYSSPQNAWFVGVVANFGDSQSFKESLIRSLIRGTILRPGDQDGKIEFQHRIWQEFLAGQHLAEKADREGEEFIERLVWRKTDGFEGIAPHWYIPLRFAAEKSSAVSDFLWNRRILDSRAVARLLPATGKDERNRWAFKTLIDYYESTGTHLLSGDRSIVSGVDDEEILTRRTRTIGHEAEVVLQTLMASDAARSRYLGTRIAWRAEQKKLLEEHINDLLVDNDHATRNIAAYAAKDFDIGRNKVILDALSNVDSNREMAASTLWELLQMRDETQAKKYLMERIKQSFENFGKRDSILGWLLSQGSAQILSQDDLLEIAEAYFSQNHNRQWKPEMARRALEVGGMGGFRVLVLVHVFGIERSLRLNKIDGQEELDKEITERLSALPDLTIETLLTLFQKTKTSFGLTHKAFSLFAKLVPEPARYEKTLKKLSRNIIYNLASVYWGDRKRSIARKLLKSAGLSETTLYYPPDTLISPARNPVRREPTFSDIIEQNPDRWLLLFEEHSMSAQVPFLSEKLMEKVRTDVQRILETVEPDTAITPAGGNEWKIDRKWSNAVDIAELLGPTTFSAECIARLARVGATIGWLMVDNLLRADGRPEITKALLSVLKAGPAPDDLHRVVYILKDRGMNAIPILKSLPEDPSPYIHHENAAGTLLELCNEAGVESQMLLSRFLDSKLFVIRFRALALHISIQPKESPLAERKEYLVALTEISNQPDLAIHRYDPYLVLIPCEGVEDDIAKLIRKLLPIDSETKHFEKQRILNWAMDHLKSGETERCVQALQEIARADKKYGWVESLADEARINRLNRIPNAASAA